jgi:hypothetical protein
MLPTAVEFSPVHDVTKHPGGANVLPGDTSDWPERMFVIQHVISGYRLIGAEAR